MYNVGSLQAYLGVKDSTKNLLGKIPKYTRVLTDKARTTISNGLEHMSPSVELWGLGIGSTTAGSLAVSVLYNYYPPVIFLVAPLPFISGLICNHAVEREGEEFSKRLEKGNWTFYMPDEKNDVVYVMSKNKDGKENVSKVTVQEYQKIKKEKKIESL